MKKHTWPGRPKPPNWDTLRQKTLTTHHHTCQIQGPHCTHTATEVDHITPLYQGGTNHPTNLRAVCHTCHQHKSLQEATQARKHHARMAHHPQEPHPGLTHNHTPTNHTTHHTNNTQGDTPTPPHQNSADGKGARILYRSS